MTSWSWLEGPLAGPAPSQPGGRELPLAGAKRFVTESIGELRKVEWPGQNQVVQGTVVVIVACVIVGIYLWLNDLAWKHVVQDLLLK